MKKFVDFVIVFYRSCLKVFLPATCKFVPSCSQYMRDAVEAKGFFRGVLLGVWRILRCHPFSKGGFDPVR